MIRFALGPDARPVPDLKQDLPGRGVWVTAKADLVNRAVDKNLFARAFKAQTVCDSDLAAQVRDLLIARSMGYLSLARKAGLVDIGFVKAELALKRDAAVLIGASDAGRQAHGKLARAAKNGVVAVTLFDSAQLGLALGRPNVVHAAIRKHGLADEFLLAVGRLCDYMDASNGCGNRASGASKTRFGVTRAGDKEKVAGPGPVES
jgi:predicted RNA-binding protein YlxR (DUF448 family)